ncbi:hypothetical protein ABEG63_21435, partial [Chryseobacterium sp. C39-AII1]|uniref:hypothetical protein n=1 Tax=Chryseobacterium sp. C39-AII1 TaxID=3080332 RepID=UPI0032099E4A
SPRDTYGEHSAFNGDFDPNSTLSSYNGMGSSSAHGMYFAQDAGGGQAGSGGETYYGKEAYDVLQSYLNPPSNNSDTGPNFWQRVGSFFGNLFGSKKKESNKVNVGIPTGSVERDMTWPIIAGLLFGNADPYSAIGNAGVGPYAEERETVGMAAMLFINPEKSLEGLESKALSRAAMSKIMGAGIRIDPKNLPKNVTEELVEILAGRGTPIIRNGVHETVRNSAKWGGALEWKIKDIPGTSLNGSRIIQHPNGKWGLVFDHNYKNIIEIPTSSTIK